MDSASGPLGNLEVDSRFIVRQPCSRKRQHLSMSGLGSGGAKN